MGRRMPKRAFRIHDLDRFGAYGWFAVARHRGHPVAGFRPGRTLAIMLGKCNWNRGINTNVARAAGANSSTFLSHPQFDLSGQTIGSPSAGVTTSAVGTPRDNTVQSEEVVLVRSFLLVRVCTRGCGRYESHMKQPFSAVYCVAWLPNPVTGRNRRLETIAQA